MKTTTGTNHHVYGISLEYTGDSDGCSVGVVVATGAFVGDDTGAVDGEAVGADATGAATG